MGKSTFEQMGGTYRQEGDYLLPNLTTPEIIPVGIWGQRRRRFLREYQQPIYAALLLSGKLDAHLADIDRQAEELYSQLVEQMADSEGVTEQLKAEHQMEWIGRMNNIRDRVTKIIHVELIFT